MHSRVLAANWLLQTICVRARITFSIKYGIFIHTNQPSHPFRSISSGFSFRWILSNDFDYNLRFQWTLQHFTLHNFAWAICANRAHLDSDRLSGDFPSNFPSSLTEFLRKPTTLSWMKLLKMRFALAECWCNGVTNWTVIQQSHAHCLKTEKINFISKDNRQIGPFIRWVAQSNVAWVRARIPCRVN